MLPSYAVRSLVAPLVAVMSVKAMTVPIKLEPEPRVAELGTTQKTLHAVPPPRTVTALLDAVMSVESVLTRLLR